MVMISRIVFTKQKHMYPNQPSSVGGPPVLAAGTLQAGVPPTTPPVKKSVWWWIVGGAAGLLILAVGVFWVLFGPQQSDTPANPGATSSNTNAATGSGGSVSTFAPQVGQTKPQVDTAAAADGRLPLCTTSGVGVNKKDICDYTATATSGKVQVVFVGGVVTGVSRPGF